MTKSRDPRLAGMAISIFVILSLLVWGTQVNNDLAHQIQKQGTKLKRQGTKLKRLAKTNQLLVEALALDSAARDQTMEKSHQRLVAYTKCVALLRRPTPRRLDACAEKGGFVAPTRSAPRPGTGAGEPTSGSQPSPESTSSPSPSPSPSSPSPSPCPLSPPLRCPG